MKNWTEVADKAPAARRIAAKAHLGRGRDELALGSPQGALREFEAAARHAESWEAAYWQGCARGWMGDDLGAEQALTRALELHAQGARLYLQRAYARFRLGRLQLALSDFEAAASRGPLEMRAQLVFAGLRLARQEWAEAEALLGSVMDQASAPGVAALMLGLALEKQNKIVQALDAYQRATGDREHGATACVRLSLLYAKQRNYERARRWIDRAIAHQGSGDSVLFHHGWISYQCARYEDCLDSWTKLDQRRGEQPDLALAISQASYARGCELIRYGHTEAALPFIEAHQSDPESLRVLAELHFRIAAQKVKEHTPAAREAAREHLLAGRRLAPDDGRFPYYLELLEAQVRPENAIALLLADRREEGIGILEQALRRDPVNGPVTHALTLACYHTARAMDDPGHPGELARLWQRVIAGWVALLHQESFWRSWQSDAGTRYRLDGSDPAVAGCRELLREQVNRLLERGFEETGDSRELKVLLRRELKAAELVSKLGGLPLPDRDGERLVCGPLMIQFLGLAGRFGDFLHGPTASSVERLFARLDDGVVEPYPERRLKAEEKKCLMRYFSSLGPAQALLDHGRPHEALKALENLSCPRCRTTRAERRQGFAAAGNEPRVCAQDCPSFDSLHPGYAGLTGKENALRRDALELMIEARLKLAESLLAAGETEMPAAVASWQEAIRLAKRLGLRERTERRILDDVLGRVKALDQNKRLDEAIALLEAAQQVSTERGDQELAGQLAELLNHRGVAAGNDKPPRLKAAVADLRRAVRYNPHASRPLINLSLALQCWAALRRWYQPAEAVRLLQEALDHLEDARARFAGQADVEEQYQSTREALRTLFDSWADALAGAEQLERSLQVLERGLRQFPGDEAMMQRIREIRSRLPEATETERDDGAATRRVVYDA